MDRSLFRRLLTTLDCFTERPFIIFAHEFSVIPWFMLQMSIGAGNFYCRFFSCAAFVTWELVLRGGFVNLGKLLLGGTQIFCRFHSTFGRYITTNDGEIR